MRPLNSHNSGKNEVCFAWIKQKLAAGRDVDRIADNID